MQEQDGKDFLSVGASDCIRLALKMKLFDYAVEKNFFFKKILYCIFLWPLIILAHV